MATSQLPPLPCWPSQVFPHEPAHAFFRRVAEVNGQFSARTLATTFGLNGRNVRPQEFVSFCESFPAANIEELSKASATVVGNHATLCGEVFTISRDIAFQRPKICPACVAERYYYRNWFDLAVVTHCPIHDQPLVDGHGDVPLAWWFPPIARTPDGNDLAGVDASAVAPSATSETWERYVLGRLGAAEPFFVPLLDEHPMWQVIYAADVLGLSAIVGWVEAGRDRLEKYDDRRGDALRAGFDILKRGEDGVREHLAVIARSGPYRVDGPKVGISKLFGGLRTAVLGMRSVALGDLFGEWLEDVAAELGVVSRKARPDKDSLGAAAYTLNETADILRMKLTKVRELAVRAGVIEPLASKNSRHWITAEGLAELRSVLDNLIARPEAADLAGLSPEEFKKRCEEIGLKPYIRIWGPGPNSDRFLKSDVTALIA